MSQEPGLCFMDSKILSELGLAYTSFDVILAPGCSFGEGKIGRKNCGAIKIDQANSSDDVIFMLAGEIKLSSAFDLCQVFPKASESDDRNPDSLGELRIDPTFDKTCN